MSKYRWYIVGLCIFIVGASVVFLEVGVSIQNAHVRDLQRKNDLALIQKLLQMSFELHGSYPTSLYNTLDNPQMPKDPNGSAYDYQLLAGGKDFKVCATMEDKSESCVGSPTSQL